MEFYEYKKLSELRTWRFNKVVTEDILNIQYIHPLKQRVVAEIVQCACKDDGVKTIRVFGSSITSKCDFDSDLDICIEWKFDCYDAEGVLVPETLQFMQSISLITQGKCDVVHFQYLEGTVVEDAAKKGVIVYVSDVE